jgi:hypothetical protein
MDHDGLRPIERRMRKLADAGVDDVEIAWRFRLTPRTVRNMLVWSELPRTNGHRVAGGAGVAGGVGGLRPIERRVLRWRDEGAGFDDVAARIRRGRS